MEANQKSSSSLDWKKYFFELVVIIAGITISFALQNWNEAQAHRQQEIQTLERMLRDLAVDTTSLQEEIRSMELAINSGVKLLEFDNATELTDSIHLAINSQLQYSVFTKSDIAYQGFKQTGRSDLVADRELLDKIVRQYTIEYRGLEEWTEIDKNFVINQFIPYFNQNFPSVESDDLEEIAKQLTPFIRESTFQNLVRFNVIIKSQIAENYLENLKQIEALMADIKKELEELR